MKNIIHTSQLCQTFLDAMEVTKQLGTQYLWIDGLCIMQGSTKDWMKESAMMNDVYRHSWCDIAATSAPDSSNRMLSPLCAKHPLASQAVRLKMALKSYEIIVISYSELVGMKEIDDAPLKSCGWVVQGLVLSPRVLYFGTRQIFWD